MPSACLSSRVNPIPLKSRGFRMWSIPETEDGHTLDLSVLLLDDMRIGRAPEDDSRDISLSTLNLQLQDYISD